MGLFRRRNAGLFQDLEAINEAVADRGGAPSVADTQRAIRSAFDDRGERKLLRSGVAATAIVRGFPMQVRGDRFAMRIPLEIHPPQGRPYTINYVYPTVRMRSALAAGMEVPIKIDPSDRRRVAVEWGAQQAAVAASGGIDAVIRRGLEQSYGTAAIAAGEQAINSARGAIKEDPAP